MDTLCLKSGISGITPSISVGGAFEVRSNATQQVSAVGKSTVEKSTGATPPNKTLSSRLFSFRYPLKSFWPGLGGGGGSSKRYKGIALEDAVLVENGEKSIVEDGCEIEPTMGTSYTKGQDVNWVLKILHVRSLWRGREDTREGEGLEKEQGDIVDGQMDDIEHGDEEQCEVCKIDDVEKEFEFDKESFSSLLRRVSLREAKLYAQMSYLGNLAYCIPKIKV